jgi:hypothetical protein
MQENYIWGAAKGNIGEHPARRSVNCEQYDALASLSPSISASSATPDLPFHTQGCDRRLAGLQACSTRSRFFFGKPSKP